jgi:heme-degrading monooxygenase HmoA
MIVVINRLKCPRAYSEHLERAFKQAGNLTGVPGFRSFSFLRDRQDGEEVAYAALTFWESPDAYQAWLKSESFARAHGEAPAGGQMTSSLEMYDVLE